MNSKSGAAALARFEAPTESQLLSASKFVQNYAAAWGREVVRAEDMKEQLHPDTRMLIPPMTEPTDRDGVVAHFAGVLQRVPDLHLEVLRWAPTGDAVIIEWEATATVLGQPVSWQGVDRFNLLDGLQVAGQAYWDTRGLEAKFAEAIAAAQTAKES